MEKKEGKERANLKLTFLDLFPSYEEIDEANDGIIISFQNSDFTYNLIELIKNREEMFVPQQIPNQTIKINLLKGSNPYATGPFTVKSGEQWVTFTYDHKKKQNSNFALSLIDCIKIKFLCKIDYVPAINNNNQITNTEFQATKNDSVLENIVPKPTPKKLYGNFTSKKKNSYKNNTGNILDNDSLRKEESKMSKILDNISQDKKLNNNLNLNNTTVNSNKNTINPLLKSENLSELSPLASSSGVIGKDFKINEKNKNKNVKKIYNNNLNNNLEIKKSIDLTPTNQKKKNKNNEVNKEKQKISNNSLNNIANTIDNKNINENNKGKQNLKRNRSKNSMNNNNIDTNNNKTKTKKKEKQTKSVTNGILNSKDQKQKKIKGDISSKNINPKKEEKIEENTDNDINNSSELNKEEKDKENLAQNNNNLIEHNEINEENNNNDNEGIIEKTDEPILDEYNDDLGDYGLDNFSKKLEEFQILYSDEYIKDIKNEDYYLEIELYIEKLIELINEYHLQLEEKDMEYQLIKNMYQKNIHQYLEIKKLNNKLELIKDNCLVKKFNSKPIDEDHDKNYINNLIINKVEINMFKYIIYSQKEKDQEEKRDKISKILKNILNKPKYKNIINQNGKISEWVKSNMGQTNQGKEKVKKKGKIQKANQENNLDKGINKKKKNVNNLYNSPVKNKNKLNKNANEDKKK